MQYQLVPWLDVVSTINMIWMRTDAIDRCERDLILLFRDNEVCVFSTRQRRHSSTNLPHQKNTARWTDSLPLLVDSKRLIWERDERTNSGRDGKDGEENDDLHCCSVDLGCARNYNVFVSFFFSYRIAILWFYAGAEFEKGGVKFIQGGRRPSVRQAGSDVAIKGLFAAEQKQSGGVRTFNFSSKRARSFTMD